VTLVAWEVLHSCAIIKDYLPLQFAVLYCVRSEQFGGLWLVAVGCISACSRAEFLTVCPWRSARQLLPDAVRMRAAATSDLTESRRWTQHSEPDRRLELQCTTEVNRSKGV